MESQRKAFLRGAFELRSEWQGATPREIHGQSALGKESSRSSVLGASVAWERKAFWLENEQPGELGR